MTPYEASKLGEKYGKGNIVLSAISSVAEIGENSVKMHDVMVDKNMTKDYFLKKKEQCLKLIDFLGIEPFIFEITKGYFKY